MGGLHPVDQGMGMTVGDLRLPRGMAMTVGGLHRIHRRMGMTTVADLRLRLHRIPPGMEMIGRTRAPTMLIKSGVMIGVGAKNTTKDSRRSQRTSMAMITKIRLTTGNFNAPCCITPCYCKS